MGKINHDIKNNFGKFEDLLNGKKLSELSHVVMDTDKKSNAKFRLSNVSVEHESYQDEEVVLMIETKKVDRRSFKFQLRAPDFSQTPFFRFDSDGPSHRNHVMSTPLGGQKIDTPHFNSFDDAGRSIAYRTEALEIEERRNAILDDINMGMAHFCDESKTFFPEEQYITVQQVPGGEMDFGDTNDNPTAGVTYD